MIDLYYWPTGNGLKIGILLEELGLEYRLLPVTSVRVNRSRRHSSASAPTGGFRRLSIMRLTA